MLITYPRELVFGVPDGDPIRTAILGAAAALGLDVRQTEAELRITIASPVEAYRFGQQTGTRLNGLTAPTPIAPEVPPSS